MRAHISDAELVHLRAPRRGPRSSGYRNVYLADNKSHAGVEIWHAQVKTNGRKWTLPNSRSPDRRHAARCVALWYLAEFGPNWPDAVKARKKNPIAVRYSSRYGGYVAAVWTLGRREEVCVLKRKTARRWVTDDDPAACAEPAYRWKPTDDLAVFATPDGARSGARRYVELRYGLFAGCVLRRG